MATKKKAVSTGPQKEGNVLEVALRDFGKKNMTTYALAVNLNRSVPDLFDGLKPVQRRILWGMANSGGRSLQKSAQTVGFVLGKLHPHGDNSVYEAMVNMVAQPTPTIFGSGNWGSMIDGPAAYRYTNSKLTGYGLSFVEPDYIHKEVTAFVPNFDDKWVEPVTLPAQLPNLLLNGVETGIGVGITTKIPSFTAESVLDVVKRMFAGEKLKAADFAKSLKFALTYGGQMVNDKANKASYLKMFSGSTARVQFESPLIIDRDRKRVIISEWPPGLDLEKWVPKVRAFAETASVTCTSGVTTYTVECKPAFNFDQFDKWVEKVRKSTVAAQSYRINVTRRKASVNDGKVSFEITFHAYSVPELLVEWCKERVALERRSLAFRIMRTEGLIDYDETMIYACANIDTIIEVLRKSDDPETALAKKLKIEAHQAKWICDLQLRKISKLDEGKYKVDLKEHKALLAQLKKWEAKPREKILLDLERIAEVVKKDRDLQDVEDNQEIVVV